MKPAWIQAGDRFILQGLPGVTAFTSNRLLDMPAGDTTVQELREWSRRAGLEVPAVVGMQQVHGSRVEKVQGGSDQVIPSCDGLITEHPGVALAVRSADCLPVVLHAPLRDFWGVAHAGWRGVREGVLSNLVQALGPPGLSARRAGGTAEVWAAIGPGIGPCCYEVGPEFDGYFPNFIQRREGKRFFDLPGAARAQLIQAGVREEAIVMAPWCSSCHPKCHSYRRDGTAARRMVTVALLAP